MNQLFLTAPLLIITVSSVALMLISAFLKLSTQKLNIITILILTLSLLFQIPLINDDFSTLVFSTTFNRMLIVDSFSALFTLLFTLGTLLTLAISNKYLKNNTFFIGEYFTLMLFALLGMMLLAMAHELITAFIALEIASLSIYILIGLRKTDARSSEGFFKYLLIGSFSGTFFLIGTLLIYLQTESTHLDVIGRYVIMHPVEEMPLLIVGGGLLMVTIFFKIGVFMFHTWVLDVYDAASMPVTMFMAATFKIAIFSIALRIFLVDFHTLTFIYQPAIEFLAVITLLGGSLLTLRQQSIKRMLAASSIVHSGYLLIALASVDSTHYIAGASIIFYLLAYFLSAVGALGILSYISQDAHQRFSYDDFNGFSKRFPLLALSMTIFMLSLAGFPSTIGFLGKFYIFTASIASEHYMLAIVGLFAAFVSIYYYFKLIAHIYFYNAQVQAQPIKFTLTPITILVIAFITIWGGIGTSLIEYLPGADGFILYAQQAVNSLVP